MSTRVVFRVDSCLPGKASIAAGKKSAAKLKAAGKGLFKVRTLSPALAAITGKSPRAHALALMVSGLR